MPLDTKKEYLVVCAQPSPSAQRDFGKAIALCELYQSLSVYGIHILHTESLSSAPWHRVYIRVKTSAFEYEELEQLIQPK